MTADRELLELAAKAAGVEGQYGQCASMGNFVDGSGAFHKIGIRQKGSLPFAPMWNPLTDDGDALRLADALELDILHRVVGGTRVEILPAGGPLTVEAYVRPVDRLAATRRAIVRAAAEIGRALP